MFDKFFKKAYKSRKTVSEEEAKKLNEELNKLKEDIKLRELQVIRLAKLLQEDPVNSSTYAKRLNIHNRIILDNKEKIQKIEIKLLDS